MTEPRALLIAGPTAAGKSALALALAERLGGVVINADSMQVYAELRVMTARPSADDERRVPHRLYGHIGAADAYSAGRYARDAAIAIREVQAGGGVPIVVGGTGLYFRALTVGLAPIPEIAPDIRDRWRQAGARMAPEALHRLLAGRDPLTASRLRPTDPQRLVRALEVLEATGRPLADWQREKGEPVIEPATALRLVVDRPREELYARIDGRLEAMIADGGLDEVGRLAALGLDPALPAMRAVGVPPLLAHIAGKIDREEAVRQAKRDTRHYVKRQQTWLKRNMVSWRMAGEKLMERLLSENLSFLDIG
jgi:tRNA dimethylallyltransferase